MEQLDRKVIDLLARPMRIEELRRLLPGVGKQELKDCIQRLSQSGQIVKNKKNRLAQAAHFGCIAGVYLATERGFGFVAPDKKDKQSDVFIPPNAGGDAWHRDRVLIRVHEDGHRRDGSPRREGEVIRVLERSREEIVGAVRRRGKSCVLEPASKKYPEIMLPKAHLHGAQPGDRVAVRMMYYGEGKVLPQAVVTQVFGENGTMQASIAAILHENGIIEGFSSEAAAQAEGLGDRIPADALEGRRDLRDQLIFTIDGDSAKDFDDAISLIPLKNGRVLLGVHIADVSHYVTPGSPLDDDAYRRGTSVYYPGHVVPMLPFALSDGLCSLVPDEDRLAFSAFLELGPDGRRHKAEFSKSVIRSKARMTYKNVNKILNGDAESTKKYGFLAETVHKMADLADILRKRRMERGALDLDIPEAEITVDEQGEPVELRYRDRGRAEKMIEEFMLQANEAVAEFMDKHSNPAVFRVHENPDPEKLRVFAQFARPFGYRIDPNKPQDTRQFQIVLDRAADDPRQRALPSLLLRSLARARYSEENLGHYGLQAKYYLHFTSPIRRYPDLATHRMLQKALAGDAFTRTDYQFCENAASQSTTRELAADTAERDIDKLYIAAYMERFLGQDFDGEVTGVQAFGIFVALPNGAEGLVRIESLPGYFEYDDQKMALTSRAGVRYTIGTPVRVRLVSANRASGQIDFVLTPTTPVKEEKPCLD